MSNRQQQIEAMKAAGYVLRQDAAKIVGRSTGGNLPALFARHGVASVTIQSDGTKPVVMYLRSDLDKVPPPEPVATNGHSEQSTGVTVDDLEFFFGPRFDEIISRLDRLKEAIEIAQL
jgi:hypothetical protein